MSDNSSSTKRGPALGDFDERGWPVNALLLILASCAAGAIAARGDFETQELWKNAWTQLAILAAIVTLIALTAMLLRGRIQRRMQLAILVSLVVHLGLSVTMRRYQLPLVAAIVNETSEVPEMYEPKLLPDYQSLDKQSLDTSDHTPIEEFERPVDTDVAEPETVRLEKPEMPEPALELPVRSEPKPSQPEPKPIELERAETSPAKRAERLANPERSHTQVVEQPVDPLQIPESQPEVRRHDELNPVTTASRAEAKPTEMRPAPLDVTFDNERVAQPSVLDRQQRAEQVAPAEVAIPRTERAEPNVAVEIPSPSVQQPTVMQVRPIVGPSRVDIGRLSEPKQPADVRSVPRASSPGATSTGGGEPSSGETAAADQSRSLLPTLGGSGPRRSEAIGRTAPGAPSPGAAGGTTIPRQTTVGSSAAGIAVPRLANSSPAAPTQGTAASQSPSTGGPRLPGPAILQPAGGVANAPRHSGSVPVHTPAPAGVGGLGGAPAPDVGMPSRLARAESEMIHTATPRLILEKTGGEPTIDARVRDTAVQGLKQRDPESRGDVARSRGGSAGTEKAVEMGLEFLARHQARDGSWSLHEWQFGRDYTDPAPGSMQSSTAATGLSLLAFLGAGYTHTDGKYRTAIDRALDYITSHQKDDGDLFVRQDDKSNLNVWLYSHGIASIALCEAYGMTRDPALRDPAQRALEFIVYAQEPTAGGWRYSPQQGSDTSVSGWQLMALKSGELAGLTVPEQTYAKVTHWLDTAQGAGGDPSRYAYLPGALYEHQRQPSRVMTAEALLMRQYLGWNRDNPNMVAGANWLHGQLPEMLGPTRDAPFGQRDAYYWYYATQVMFQMQGRYWVDWNHRLRSLLVDSQEQVGGLAGSWHPTRPVPDRWGREGGRLYVTAMHLLMLEVYYRHLPIYQTLD